MTDITFIPEDTDYRLTIVLDFRDGPEYIEVFYSCVDVEQLDPGEEGTISLEAVQALIGDCSPVGCNSCDLGDVLIDHRHNCPIHLVPSMVITFYGEVNDS